MYPPLMEIRRSFTATELPISEVKLKKCYKRFDLSLNRFKFLELLIGKYSRSCDLWGKETAVLSGKDRETWSSQHVCWRVGPDPSRCKDWLSGDAQLRHCAKLHSADVRGN